MLEHDTDGSGAAVLAALARLAAAVAAELVAGGLTIVGVTGSSGKTSTKDLLAAVLAPLGEVVAPPGSFNNELGHPWTVLRATTDTDYLILEMSARHPGNIAALAAIAPPSIAVVLNVGTAHLGEFGSREAIAAHESRTAASCSGVRSGHPQRRRRRGRGDGRADRRPGGPGGALAGRRRLGGRRRRSTSWPGRGSRCTPAGGEVDVALAVHGDHQVSNALCAAAVALECGASRRAGRGRAGGGRAGVAAPDAGHHPRRRRDRRQRRLQRQPGLDAGRAEGAGLDGASQGCGRRGASWAVLGEMAELGDDAIAEHDSIGRLAVRLDVSSTRRRRNREVVERHAPRGGDGGVVGR